MTQTTAASEVIVMAGLSLPNDDDKVGALVERQRHIVPTIGEVPASESGHLLR